MLSMHTLYRAPIALLLSIVVIELWRPSSWREWPDDVLAAFVSPWTRIGLFVVAAAGITAIYTRTRAPQGLDALVRRLRPECGRVTLVVSGLFALAWLTLPDL